MNDENKNQSNDINISVSLIDYIGKLEDGVGVILSLLFENDTYEIIYWFNPKNDYRIIIEEKFYKKYKIKDIYEYEYLIDLLFHIDTNILPDRNEIFKKFL